MSDDWLAGAPMDPTSTPPEPLPALPGFPFLHAGAGAVIVGPTGGGRSSLIQAAMYDATKAGLRCAYFGSEVPGDEFDARAAVLANLRGDHVDDELCRRLAQVRYLDLASVVVRAWDLERASKQHDDEFVARMNVRGGLQSAQTKHGPTSPWADLIVARYELIAFDPLSSVANALDLDFDKANAEFIRFYDRLVQPLTARGVTVVMVDNIGHAEEAKARAKGVSAKQDKPDLTFSCSVSTTPPGLVLKAGKVRSVRAGHRRGDEWLFTKDTQRIVRRDTANAEERATFRPTKIMERVSEAVERDAGLTRNAIRTTVGGRAEYVSLALELLVSEGYIETEKDSQALRHRSVRQYREQTESTESLLSPDRVPDSVLGTESNRVPPPVGGGPATGPSGDGNSNGADQVPDADAELERAMTKFEEAR
jgi:hypothetical protein